MKQPIFVSLTIIILVVSAPTITFVYGTNEGSYQYGYQRGSLTGPQFAPAETNTTACQDGFYNGYKNWCINHAVDCVENITIGDFPPMILQAHEQYLAGAKAANDSGNSMCPIGENIAFCRGWDNNNGDYGDWDCGDAYDNYTGPFSSNLLVGCPLDTLKPSQMAALPILVGNWHYVNSSLGSTISGKVPMAT
jgi:hypothetical protein